MRTTVQLKQAAVGRLNVSSGSMEPPCRPAIVEINEIQFTSEVPQGCALAAHINEIAMRLVEEHR